MAQKWDLDVYVFPLDLYDDFGIHDDDIKKCFHDSRPYGVLSAHLVHRLQSWLTQKGFDLNKPIHVMLSEGKDGYDFRQ